MTYELAISFNTYAQGYRQEHYSIHVVELNAWYVGDNLDRLLDEVADSLDGTLVSTGNSPYSWQIWVPSQLNTNSLDSHPN